MKVNSLAKRLLIAFIFITSTVLSCYANENVISSVIISKAKDNVNTYELNIDSTDVVQYKSHIDSDGNVVFDLKNSVLAQDLGTIYDDVSNVDNVTVKQDGHNHVKIYVSGKDVKKTDLVFVNSLIEPVKDQTKKVTINRPISEYKSTNYEDDLEYQEEIQDWDDNSFNFSHLTSTLLTDLKNGISGKILIFLLALTILSVIMKNITSKLAQDKEPLIGLNNQRYMTNNYQVGQVKVNKNKKQMADSEELPSVASRNRTLKQAQIELQKAHLKYQQYVQNKYQQNSIKKPVETDNLRQSIALNQYQRSTVNPYKNQEVIRMNEIQSMGVNNYDIKPVQRPKTQTRPEFSSPYIQRKNNFIEPTKNINSKTKNNMKFLESVTKIYERSGRGDLADELKNSISKAKQTTY